MFGTMLGRFWRTAEDRIREAIRNGELDNLPGKGRPLALEALDPLIPREQQLIIRMVRNSQKPATEEVELARELVRVRKLLGDTGLAPGDRARVEAHLAELEARAEALLRATEK